MNIQQLQALVIDALEDVKAQDIQLFDTMHLTSMFERLVIASGTSNRQTRALAMSVRDKVKEAGGNVVGMEGEDTGEWVLVDLGDMVVHIMQAPIRAYYRLEELWGERPIAIDAAKKLAKGKGKAKADAGIEADAAPAAKPKRPSRRNDSANEALEKPKKVRKSAASLEGAAPAPRSRAKKADDGTAATPAPRSRARKPLEGETAAAPRARRIVVAETVEARTHKAAKAAAASAAKPAPKPRVRKPVAAPAAGTAPHTPRAKKPRAPADE